MLFFEIIQRATFCQDSINLIKRKNTPFKDKLLGRSSFVDENLIIRVEGRNEISITSKES